MVSLRNRARTQITTMSISLTNHKQLHQHRLLRMSAKSIANMTSAGLAILTHPESSLRKINSAWHSKLKRVKTGLIY